jgi:hypothetical protein
MMIQRNDVKLPGIISINQLNQQEKICFFCMETTLKNCFISNFKKQKYYTNVVTGNQRRIRTVIGDINRFSQSWKSTQNKKKKHQKFKRKIQINVKFCILLFVVSYPYIFSFFDDKNLEKWLIKC